MLLAVAPLVGALQETLRCVEKSGCFDRPSFLSLRKDLGILISPNNFNTIFSGFCLLSMKGSPVKSTSDKISIILSLQVTSTSPFSLLFVWLQYMVMVIGSSESQSVLLV